jgi:hypothetical protein
MKSNQSILAAKTDGKKAFFYYNGTGKEVAGEKTWGQSAEFQG